MAESPSIRAFDDLDANALSQRISEKWNTYPKDALAAWVAEMDFPVSPAIRSALQEAVDRSDFGYPVSPRDTGLPEVFAERMASRFDWHVDPARCEILTDVVQGLYIGLCAYSEPGAGAIVQTPIYPPFLKAVSETGRTLVENRLQAGPERYEVDFDALRDACDERTQVLMLCNPHNPTGRAYERSELEQLAELVLARDLTVLSDEIHGDLVFDGRRHVPFASLSSEIAARTVTLTSATKAFNIPGLRCAVGHFGSESLQKRYRGAFPRHVAGGVGLLGITATIAAWRDSQPWLDDVLRYLADNRTHVAHALAERFPRIRALRPEATYLTWLDCSGLALAGSPAAHFLREGRVVLSDGSHFGSGYESFARLNFATSRGILDQVLDRMATALGER